MTKLRVRHEFMIQLHSSRGVVAGTVELTTDVDYLALSAEDRAFLDDLLHRFEERANQ
jgi:hypothetical protein